MELHLKDLEIEKVSRFFKILSHREKLRILNLLESGEKGSGELIEITGQPQPNVSRYLLDLYEIGLIRRRRVKGQWFFSIKSVAIADVLSSLKSLIGAQPISKAG